MRNLILTSLLTIASVHAVNAKASESAERILGYQPSRSGVSFQVTSGGCTQREDFKTEIKRSPSNVAELTLIRVRPDTCAAYLPIGIRFEISYAELGLAASDQFTVKNESGIIYESVWFQEQSPEPAN